MGELSRAENIVSRIRNRSSLRGTHVPLTRTVKEADADVRELAEALQEVIDYLQNQERRASILMQRTL